MKNGTFLIALLIQAISLTAQDVNYNLFLDDKQVGYLQFSKRDSAEFEVITAGFSVRTSIMFIPIVICDRKEVVRNESGIVTITADRSTGVLDAHRSIHRIGLSYINERNKMIDLQVKSICSIEMLNSIPRQKLIWSEFHQCYATLQRINDAHYRFSLPDNSSYDYYYENGRCTKMVTTTSMAVVTALLDKSTVAKK